MKSQAYKEGWNANIKGVSIFSNPYVGSQFNPKDCASWSQGWKDCQKEWDNLPSFKNQPDKL